jgi:polygalacturonase
MGQGLVNGKGGKWWGIPGIGYLERGENRPRLVVIPDSKDILFENIILKDSPYWTFYAPNANGLEVRFSSIDARRLPDDGHDIVDITAFNTDGFDVTVRNVWIHDCSIWNDDDTIAVKDNSQDMVFERINASGVGLTIGSIGSSTVRNITFRDCYMHKTYKGIYMKFRGGGGHVSDVTYENIYMEEPSQTAIWIGPAQQSDSDNLCAAHPCSICWPSVPFAKCEAPNSTYTNITFRNITIHSPKQSPGVILGSEFTPIQNIVFDNVRVTGTAGTKPFGSNYYCEGVATGVATGGTDPVPACFKDETTHAKTRHSL